MKGQAAPSQALDGRQRRRDGPGAGRRVTPTAGRCWSPGRALFSVQGAPPGVRDGSHTPSGAAPDRGGEESSYSGTESESGGPGSRAAERRDIRTPPPPTACAVPGGPRPAPDPCGRVRNDLGRSGPCGAGPGLPDPHSPAQPRPQRRGKGWGRGPDGRGGARGGEGAGPEQGGGGVRAGAGPGRNWSGAQFPRSASADPLPRLRVSRILGSVCGRLTEVLSSLGSLLLLLARTVPFSTCYQRVPRM